MSTCQYTGCDRQATIMIQHRNPNSGVLVAAEPCCNEHGQARIDTAPAGWLTYVPLKPKETAQ